MFPLPLNTREHHSSQEVSLCQGMCYWHEIALKPRLKIPFVLLRSLAKGLGSERMACEHVPPFAGGANGQSKMSKIVGVHGYTGSMLVLEICGHDGCG